MFKRKDKKLTKDKNLLSNIDTDALEAGAKLVDQMKEERVNRPSNIQIDFASVATSKDLIKYLITLSEQHFDAPKTATYKAIKYNDGFMYEIHENGNGYGYLSSVLKLLESNKDAVILLDNDRRVKISRDGKHIKTIHMNESDMTEPSEELERKDKLSPVFTPSVGFFFFGFSLTIVGVIAVLLGLTFKYLIINQEQVMEYPIADYKTPMEASLDPKMRVNNKSERVTQMKYSESKGWYYKKDNKTGDK
jgi:hypothetical protein